MRRSSRSASCDRQPLRLSAAVPQQRCARWLALIDACAARLPPEHPALQPTSASLRLSALGPDLFDDLLRTVTAGPAGPALRSRLGDELWCLSAQCWARRQAPPQLRPAGQHPHQWHQDGALHCRFDGTPEALIEMATVWIALMDCGDNAPSLQWVDEPAPGLLQPAELIDAAIADRFGSAARRHAVLTAGDALVFGGALLHRTHALPSMMRRRVSMELRFIAAGALPPRLEQEHEPVIELATAAEGLSSTCGFATLLEPPRGAGRAGPALGALRT